MHKEDNLQSTPEKECVAVEEEPSLNITPIKEVREEPPSEEQSGSQLVCTMCKDLWGPLIKPCYDSASYVDRTRWNCLCSRCWMKSTTCQKDYRFTQWKSRYVRWERNLDKLYIGFYSNPFGPMFNKLDGVGPVDNRPSTDKLHQIVRKKRRRKKRRKKLWHVTHDMWHVTCDTWHVTHDTLGGMNILSKFQLPSSYCLFFMILWRYWGKGWLTESMNQWRGCL